MGHDRRSERSTGGGDASGDAEDELRHRAPARRGRDRADGGSIAAIEHAEMVETAIGPAAAFLSSGRAVTQASTGPRRGRRIGRQILKFWSGVIRAMTGSSMLPTERLPGVALSRAVVWPQ
jgi:hypothetical protein